MKTKLHYYKFDISEEKDRVAYIELRKKLKGMGLMCFRAWEVNDYAFYKNHIIPLDNTMIELETNYLFNNQWNTAPNRTSETGIRVFDWAELYLENKHIKKGYWLEQTREMKEMRDNTTQCGYCGAYYQAQKGYVFCDKCLDSEYLKEEDLHLLRLRPVSVDKFKVPLPPLTEAEKAYLVPLYIKRQFTGENSRNAKKLRKQREKIERNYQRATESAKNEHDGLLWLMDHNISIDNVIYYSHTQRFCFGWRSPVSETVKNKLLDILCGFPFDYDIK